MTSPTRAPVMVCDKCGRGFLVAQPHRIDQYPIWVVLSTGQEGPRCTGTIRMISYNSALRLAEKQERYRASQTIV